VNEREIATLANKQFHAAEESQKLIAAAREKALKFYRQETSQYVKRRSQDHSGVTTSNTRDVVETVLPQVLEPFLQGDAVVFAGDGSPQDKQLVEIETKAVNRVLDVDNNRFDLFEMWFRDALLQKNGYVKTFVKEIVTRKPEKVEKLNGDQLAQLQMTLDQQEVEDFEIEAYLAGEEVEDIKTLTEEQLNVALFDVYFTIIKRTKKIIIANVAPENIRVAPNWQKVQLHGCPYVGESVFLLRGELKELYPEKVDIIDRAPQYLENDTPEHVARRQDSQKGLFVSAFDKDSETIELREHYIMCNADDSGKLKLWKICTIGDSAEDVLEKYQVEDNPYDVVTPVRQPHQHFGLSVADMVVDIDEIDTVIWRESLDAMYRSLQPRPVLNTNAVDPELTYEDLASTHPMAPIRVRGDANSSIGWVAPPNTSQYTQQMFPLVDALLEKRTGLSRQAQGLDSTALANSTNMVGTMVMNQSLMRVKMILRTFAETGVRSLMQRVRKLLLEVNALPQGVPIDRDVEAKVGVGLTDRIERQISGEKVIGLVEKIVAAQGGVDERGLVNASNVYNLLRDFMQDLNVVNRDQYLTNPADLPPPPPPEDEPLDAALELEQGKLIATTNAKAAELELDAKKHSDDVRLKLLELQMKAKQQNAEIDKEFAKLRLQAQTKAQAPQTAPEGSVRAKYGL
jgi:hypothetical protein